MYNIVNFVPFLRRHADEEHATIKTQVELFQSVLWLSNYIHMLLCVCVCV